MDVSLTFLKGSFNFLVEYLKMYNVNLFLMKLMSLLLQLLKWCIV